MLPQGTTVTAGCERSRVTGCKFVYFFPMRCITEMFLIIIIIIIKVFDFVTAFIGVLVLWVKGPTLILNF